MIRVAMVGCGGMAAHYLSAYRDLDWVSVETCVDLNPESASRAASIYPNAPVATTDLRAALADNIDAVVINTPNSEHAPQAIVAIGAGKHLLLQKPVASSLADAEAIERVAQGSSKTIGLYMSYFDQPLIHDIRDMAKQGLFGDVVHCYARLMHKGGMMWSREALAGKHTWRGSLAGTGGGCFIQLAVHFVHIFEWVTGARAVRATAFSNNLHCPGIEGEDIASAVLQLESGALVTLDMAWCSDGEELSIQGTRGKIHYRSNRWLAVASSAGSFEGRALQYSGDLTEAFGGPEGEEMRVEIRPPAFGNATNPLNQHRVFLEAVRDGRPAPVTIAAGVRDMRVVAAIYESARSGRAVEVS